MNNINRSNTFDIAKGIAIILMCIGHTKCPDRLCEFIYMFHMAFFFMASGWFFSEISLDSFPKYLYKKVKGLWLPFVLWGIAFILLHNWFLQNGLLASGNIEYTFKDVLWKAGTTIPRFITTEEMMGPYWFLSSLFYVCICSWFIFWISNMTSYPRIVSTTIFALIYLLAWADIWWGIGIGTKTDITFCVCAIFFISKELNRGGHLMPFIKRYPYICIILTLGVLLTGMYIGRGHIATPTLELQNPVVYIIYSLCGFILLLAVSLYIEKIPSMERIMTYIGRKTLVILLSNMLCIRLMEWIIAKATSYQGEITDVLEMYSQWYVWIGYTIFMLVLPLSINEIYHRVKDKIMFAS